MRDTEDYNRPLLTMAAQELDKLGFHGLAFEVSRAKKTLDRIAAATTGTEAVSTVKREAREVPPGEWKVDMPDGTYCKMPGDPPGPGDIRAVIGGYVYNVEPRTGKLRASLPPKPCPSCTGMRDE